MARQTHSYGILAVALVFWRQLAHAQNPAAPEVHPSLPTWKCTTAGGCVQQNTSVVLDWDARAIVPSGGGGGGGGGSCKTATGGVSASLCPDEATCAKNCVVQPIANYTEHGVSTAGDALTLYHYVRINGQLSAQSPRVYLLGPDGDYEMLHLLGRELSFDVDLSTLPCGENGALYLSEMSAGGGRNPDNTGGASYGSGYCDAQCPTLAWRNGTINTGRQGYCCDEMDILEANSQANAFTPHPCRNGNCDKSGCGYNPYAKGFRNYWGPGMTVDTSKPFTITTQFVESGGSLSQIVRRYAQGGRPIPSAASGGDVIQASACGTAQSFGGLAEMGAALDRGMVLVFSIWNDPAQNMNWLDSGTAGPCSSAAGSPATIQAQHPDTHVVFSNIRWGDIGSTTQTS